jgi:type I restriction enzyme, R subunit
LGKKLFIKRLELIGELDRRIPSGDGGNIDEADIISFNPESEAEVRDSLGAQLQREVAAMNLNNFVIRPRRRFVEKFASRKAWSFISSDDRLELAREVAGLPTELEVEKEEAKRFDLLMLNLQLAYLRSLGGYENLRDQVKAIAALLEEKSAIPLVLAQMEFIQEVQTDAWWQNVTIPMLESARRRLRNLIHLIEKQKRKLIYTDFEDVMGSENPMDLPGFASGMDFERFHQ